MHGKWYLIKGHSEPLFRIGILVYSTGHMTMDVSERYYCNHWIRFRIFIAQMELDVHFWAVRDVL